MGFTKKSSDIIKRSSTEEEMTLKKDTSLSDAAYSELKRRILSLELMPGDIVSDFSLSQEIGMSRTVLYNKLKLLTGLNVKEYVTKIRIERACRLIRETDLSITEVAEQTGFSSSRYFSTAFKQHMGMTPSQYKSGPQAEQEQEQEQVSQQE